MIVVEEKNRLMQEEENKLSGIFDLIGFPIEHTMQSCTHDNRVKTTVNGPMLNRKLVRSQYYERSTRFLHFTSWKAVYSMINEQSLRLYNLHNSSDPNEYTCISNDLRNFYTLFGYDEDAITNRNRVVKDNYFIFSVTSVSNLTSVKHWNEYGEKGNGVALEFEILNDPYVWDGFHFSPVFYYKPDNWELAIDQLKQLQICNTSNSYNFLYDILLCLHKSHEQKYVDEKELRILAHRPTKWGFAFDALISSDLGKDGISPVRYLRLPLFAETSHELSFENQIRSFNSSCNCSYPINEQYFIDFLNNSPKIKLSKVHVSRDFRLKGKVYYEFERSFSDFVYNKLGYSPEIICD